MILWTIQHQKVFDILEKNGLFCASEDHLLFQEPNSKELFAYNWLCAEMLNRVSPPPHGVKYPIWAWHSWEGSYKKPDMRKSGYAQKNLPIVRIKLDIPDNEVLLSDFDLWHYALNHWYLASSLKDENIFDQMDEQAKETMIQKSWQFMFDLSLHDDGYVFGSLTSKSIQATFWELKIENVISAESFIAK